MLYNSVTDILREYPQKNSIWNPLDSEFVAEMSDFTGQKILDPWNRGLIGPLKPHRDGTIDNEIICWTTVTTVNGHKIVLRIFND